MLKRNTMLLLAGLVIVVAAGALVLLNNDTACCADDAATVQDLSPAAYQDEFITASTDHLLIDVRTPEEFSSGHIAGAVNIPVDALANRLSEVPTDQPVVVYCRSGNRSAQASDILANAGYSSIYDLGGINTWTAQGFPIQ